MTAGLGVAAYLALMGGNQLDTGRPGDKKNWWGNIDEIDPSKEYHSETQLVLDGLPATSGNLVVLQNAANRDLSFFLTENIASSVDVFVAIVAPKRVEFAIDIQAEGAKTEFRFTENWEARE